MNLDENRKERILLVYNPGDDGNLDLLKLMKINLDYKGYDVYIPRHENEIGNIYNNDEIDAVITNYGYFCCGNGKDFFSRFQKKSPVIMVIHHLVGEYCGDQFCTKGLVKICDETHLNDILDFIEKEIDMNKKLI